MPSILASSKGVILLHFPLSHRLLYVFNPVTGGIMPVSAPFAFKNVALAVDIDAQNSAFHYKLVTVEKVFPTQVPGNIVWRFTVVVPSSGCGISWLVNAPVELITRGSPAGSYSRSAYAHGCLYWPDYENNSIIEFDVEKEMARIMNWPLIQNHHKFCGLTTLFGSSDDGSSLQCVWNLQDEFVISGYDHVKCEWQLKHKISKFDIHNFDLRRRGCTLFYDGQHLFIEQERGVVFMNDVMGGTSKILEESRSGARPNFYKPPFFSFVPTLAKVSDKYLQNPRTEFPFGPDIRDAFEGLQRLLAQQSKKMLILI